MTERELYIGRWTVLFLFGEEGYDKDWVLEALYECGASDRVLRQAKNLMVMCKHDCGFTVTNPAALRAVVFIGPASSGAEFTDTFVHEIHHLAVAVAAELGIDLESETPAYIAGDSARALAEVVCELGCRHCRK